MDWYGELFVCDAVPDRDCGIRLFYRPIQTTQMGQKRVSIIEVNSGRESQKSGVLPEDAEQLVRQTSVLPKIKVMGLMTMGPQFGNPEDFRPYFAETRRAFERIERLDLPNVEMRYLSMGMTDSYRVAIDEGANIIRIGTKIFGERGRSL